MTEQNSNPNPTSVATPETAVEYITSALTNGELHMKTACKTLGWSFPRIRSRALTIAKKLKCTFTQTSRGVYILEPIDSTVPTPSAEPSVEAAAVVDSDATVVDERTEDDEPTLDPAAVEAALLGNDTPPSEA